MPPMRCLSLTLILRPTSAMARGLKSFGYVPDELTEAMVWFIDGCA